MRIQWFQVTAESGHIKAHGPARIIPVTPRRCVRERVEIVHLAGRDTMAAGRAPALGNTVRLIFSDYGGLIFIYCTHLFLLFVLPQCNITSVKYNVLVPT